MLQVLWSLPGGTYNTEKLGLAFQRDLWGLIYSRSDGSSINPLLQNLKP
jgi:hypothetical protein